MAVSQQLAPLQWHLVKIALAARAEGTESKAEHTEDWHTVGPQEASTPLSPCLLCGPDGGSSSLFITLKEQVRGQHGTGVRGTCPAVWPRKVLVEVARPLPTKVAGQEGGQHGAVQGPTRSSQAPTRVCSFPDYRGPPGGGVLSFKAGTYVSSSFFMSLERNFSLKLARVTSPGYFRSSKFSSDTSWSSASEEAKEWAAGSDCKRPAGRCFNQLAGAGRPARG